MADETAAEAVALNEATETPATTQQVSTPTAPTTRKVRAGVGEGDIVGVTIQLPKALYQTIEALAKADERTVPHYLLRQIREQYMKAETTQKEAKSAS